MRGKIVNLCIGFTNILFGILIILFTLMIPQDKTLLTIQEGIVVNYLLYGIYVLMIAVAVVDIIQYYNHRRDTVFNTAYLIGIFVISFIFIKEAGIGLFSIISGLIVVIKSLKENLVEIDSTTAISVAVVLMIASVALSCLSISYQSLGVMIKDEENKDELSYKKDYFKYITELGIEEAYINVKKDGKYGYISENGNIVIDFIYDYASPFIKINMYNKNFEIALVCKDGSSYIILKNKREVLSYRSESSDENYKAKLEELQKIYSETLGQPGEMQFEILEISNHINKVPVYEEAPSENYTFRYNYNEKYDLIITQSNLGLGDKFEFADKDNLDIRISLDTTNLDYDSNYLYLFSNGYIPFYEISKFYQGWFEYAKKIEMRGKAQILDFYDDKILIRNYNNGTVYFINSEGNILSEQYKDIFVCDNNKFIVKSENGKIKVIDSTFNKIMEPEYDVFNTRLVSKNLYLCMNLEQEIEFNDYGYAKMKFNLIDNNGNIILDNIEQIYDKYFELPNEEGKKDEKYKRFAEDLKDLKYEFVGDKFYYSYNK